MVGEAAFQFFKNCRELMWLSKLKQKVQSLRREKIQNNDVKKSKIFKNIYIVG